jgi:glycosyltransferase involved in cell wall biosynthesis
MIRSELPDCQSVISDSYQQHMANKANKPLKIGLTIWMFKEDTGGLCKHAFDLVRELQQRGHEITVVTRASTFEPQKCDYMFCNELVPSTNQSGILIKHLVYKRACRPVQWLITKLHHRRGFGKLAVWLYWLQARSSAIDSLRGCDLIHHVGQSSALVGHAAARAADALGIPFLVQPTIHPNQAGDSALDLWLFRHANRLLVHSKFEESYFKRNGFEQPISVVGNGIPDRSDGVPQRFRDKHGIPGSMVLYIGRKEANKGYDLVQKAWLQAKQEMPGLNLVCIGPTGTSSPAPPQSGLLDLQFCDEQTKHDALAACDCLCVPSEGESFGLIFMEAGRYEKPVIARRLPVLVELLGTKAALLLGQETAFNRVEVTADEIAKGIIRVLTDNTFAAELGRNLRVISSQFVWSRVVDSFIKSYELSLYDWNGEGDKAPGSQ